MKQKALVAEFIGTFALVFVGVGVMTADSMTGGKVGLIGIALAHGLIFAVMVSATAAISGGHLNPAVTLGALVARKIDRKTALAYMIAQCLGAVVGSLVVEFAMPVTALATVGFGIPVVGPNITPLEAVLTEAVLTFFLMFAYCGTVMDRRAPQLGGLFIGLTVTLGILVGAPISGAAMNPARHFGPALISATFDNIWIYWIGPFIGAGLAALIYNSILERE